MSVVQPIRNISINSVNNGYVVVVGCQTFVFPDHNSLLISLTEYLIGGRKVEEKIMKEYHAVAGERVPESCPPPQAPTTNPTSGLYCTGLYANNLTGISAHQQAADSSSVDRRI